MTCFDNVFETVDEYFFFASGIVTCYNFNICMIVAGIFFSVSFGSTLISRRSSFDGGIRTFLVFFFGVFGVDSGGRSGNEFYL